ncbi:MAG: energy-coupling factor ABC transporter ATP-binding protein [Treponemataceae bacterium]|nr:energy-coupling factor ABC transporter ATP-binding protein [Treponemataceae bacterium]
MSQNEIAVSIKCGSFKYSAEGNTILEDFQMDINYGQVTLISGFSGCGKSTLISLINGVIPRVVHGFFQGQILIDGQDIAGKSMSQISRKVGSVLQNAESQIIHQIVEDEISFGCENIAFPPEKIDEQIERNCELMKLERKWKTRTLSGGQKQRVVTASTLAMDADILIFDEPLANLDVTGAEILLKLLKKLASEGKAVLLVEHRLDVVLPYVDRIWQIKDKKALAVENKAEYLKSQIDIIADQEENRIKSDRIILDLDEVTKSFGKRRILDGISAQIYQGERILLAGENGSGKSTLMSIIGRLLKSDGGKVTSFLKENKKGDSRTFGSKKWFEDCGIVYQNPNYQLFMSSVRDEILFGARDKNYALQVAERFDLIPLMECHPQSLSEGQKRRVTIASILAQKPKILLLDEPTVGQDYQALQKMMKVLNEIHREEKNTMISVTHDIRCVSALCDRKLTIKNGRIQ